jgi:hypothetical protein
MNLTQARRFALSLDGVTEEPHFDRTSFRVRGKFFATARPEESHLHVFLPEEERERVLALYPECTTRLYWGKKAVGLRVELPDTSAAVGRDLLRRAWEMRTPKPPAQKQLAGFIARYSPTVAAQFRKARTKVKARFPRGYELVFDNYNACGCGYSWSSSASDVVVSVVAYPRWVTLFFFNGTRLPDPEKILEGTGSRVRSVRLQPLARLDSKPVQTLLKKAIAQFAPQFSGAPAMSTVIKTATTTRRSRRPRGQ